MLSREFLYIHNNSETSTMISNVVFVNVHKIISAIFSPISVRILKNKLCIRSLTISFIIFLCWLLYGTKPRLYCHKLISFGLLQCKFIKVFRLLRLIFWFLFYFWNINLLYILVAFKVNLLLLTWLFLFFILYLLLFRIWVYFPQNCSTIITSCR